MENPVQIAAAELSAKLDPVKPGGREILLEDQDNPAATLAELLQQIKTLMNMLKRRTGNKNVSPASLLLSIRWKWQKYWPSWNWTRKLSWPGCCMMWLRIRE
jgi:hypothetical protein